MTRNCRDVTFSTLNFYNLQLPGKAMYADGRTSTDEQYARKIDWTASMLQTVDADVIAFQELWSADALKEAFEAAPLAETFCN